MHAQAPVDVVAAWIGAANAQDADRLLALSDPNIEIVGPRGSGYGGELLRDWLTRAGLTMETLRVFARGNVVVLEQRGIWRSVETGELTGEKRLASVFQTDGGNVTRFARFDDLMHALDAASLTVADEVPSGRDGG